MMSLLTRLGLLQFLRNAIQSPQQASIAPIYVLGNPSADLDSIISAIVYAYFSTRDCGSSTDSRRQYVPVINLPEVPTGKELRRLRPEFATALRMATKSTTETTSANHPEEESAILRDCAFTVADWKGSLESVSESGRAASTSDGRPRNLDIMLVDWNALPEMPNGHGIEGISNVYGDVDIRVVGCIDHHWDECFVPAPSSLPPFDSRVIRTGVGSCTSMIVQNLRSRGLWSDRPASQADVDASFSHRDISQEKMATIYESQVAKLALAAILIDTANMAAKDKVSDVDHAAVDFLERKIQQEMQIQRARGQHCGWNRTQFYEEVLHAKQTSLENLTVQEALGRDFKEWTEIAVSRTSKEAIKLGICSVVKPISWLISKSVASMEKTREESTGNANGGNIIFDELKDFATDRNLDVVVVMTAFSSSNPNKPFQRELIVWALNEKSSDSMQRFEEESAAELGLEHWGKGEKDQDRGHASLYETQKNGWRKIWHQGNVSKSRKQVAPLLRSAITQETSNRDKL